MHSKDVFEIYLGESDEYRWRRVAPNGHTTARSDTGYPTITECQDAIALLNQGDRRCTVRIR